MNIAAETKEFRDAIGEWAKSYAALRARPLHAPTLPGPEAALDLQRWSRRHFGRPDQPAIID